MAAWTFFTFGHEPVLLEILSKGHIRQRSAASYSLRVQVAEVPLVETVPGRATTLRSKNQGQGRRSAIKKKGKTIYYGQTAEEVPQGRLPAEGSELDLRSVSAV